MDETARLTWFFSALALLVPGLLKADIYKYVDAVGHVYFTDTPLQGNRYRLEWQREASKVVSGNLTATDPRAGIIAQGRVLTSRPAAPLTQSQSERRALYHPLVLVNARRYGLSPSLIHAIIRAESSYNPQAVSPKGAQGLMQLMPATAARYGVRDPFDPAENIRGGAAYLRDLLDLFGQDVKLALAGYNAGEGAVLKYGRQIPPYDETQEYVRRVLHFYVDERPASFILTAR
ncbi:lytic transglycosylase domain-containing protein [Caldichromatium japonicum]|nr:lytic transglycosylase domain-containing protein [Caldichromatium japonicum]